MQNCFVLNDLMEHFFLLLIHIFYY